MVLSRYNDFREGGVLKMDEKQRKWMFVLALAVLLIACVVFFILTRSSVDKNPSIGIIGGADGPTTIYVASPFQKRYFVFAALAFIAADLCILTVIKAVETAKNRNLKPRYKALILILFNLIAEITVLPSAFAVSTAATIVIIIVFIVNYFIEKRAAPPGA